MPVNVAVQWALDGPLSAGLWAGPGPPRPWWERMMKADGTSYRAGEIFRWPEYADTLEELAATSCELLPGEPDGADGLLQPGDRGLFQEQDLRTTARSGWSPSPRTTRGYTVCEIRPTAMGSPC